MNTNMDIILDILCHKYKKEYYSLKTFTNIFKNSNTFEYLKIIKPKVTATYKSEDCA